MYNGWWARVGFINRVAGSESSVPHREPTRQKKHICTKWVFVGSRKSQSRFWGRGCDEALFSEKKGFSVKRGEAIQWIRGLVRISTGKASQWRGSGHSLNRRTLKIEKLLSSSPSQKSALKEHPQKCANRQHEKCSKRTFFKHQRFPEWSWRSFWRKWWRTSGEVWKEIFELLFLGGGGESSEAFSTKTPPQISPSNFTTRFWVVAGPSFCTLLGRIRRKPPLIVPEKLQNESSPNFSNFLKGSLLQNGFCTNCGTEQNPGCRCGRGGSLSTCPFEKQKIIPKNWKFLQLAVLHLSAFQNFRPEFYPEFCSKFSPNFRGVFVLRFVGNGDQKKFTKNPRHFSMQNSQANTRKKFTRSFWGAGKVTYCGEYHWGQEDYLPNSYSRKILFGNVVCFVSAKEKV